MLNVHKTKQDICEIGRRLYNKGFAAANDGNITVRVSESEVLCTPTMHSKGFLKPDYIATVDMQGKQIAGRKKRSSEALLHLVPAARSGAFDEFSASLYRFGRLAGECFAAQQGGPFASGRLAELVETIRGLGFEGVGQSSWGPTLFVPAEDEDRARQLTAALSAKRHADPLETTIARVANEGATVTKLD